MAGTPDMPAREVNRRWLWGVRISTLVSILLLFVPPYLVVPHLGDPCADVSLAWLVVPLVALVPYLVILWRLRTTLAKGASNIHKGVALAVPWGLMVCLITLLVGWWWISQSNRAELVSPLGMGGWVLLGLSQLALVASAIKPYFLMALRAADWRILKRNSAGAGIFLFMILIVWVGSQLPLSSGGRRAANEYSTVGSLRTINSAQIYYADMSPEKGFAATLAELGPPPGADLIEQRLASGEDRGYQFTVVTGPGQPTGRIVSYTVRARPLKYGRTGCRSFFTDESGVIRLTKEDRPATADDPPLE